MFKKLFLPIGFVLSIQPAWASSDNFCEPNWTINQNGYNRCSNLPILSPGNDTRINLKLLLVDSGLAALKPVPVSKEDAESGYGAVPFSLETSESFFIRSKPNPDGSNSEEASGSYGSGTRCSSNEAGKTDFIEAVGQSANLSGAERKLLIEARQKLTPDCADRAVSVKPAQTGSRKTANTDLASTTFLQFKQYLDAAGAFYEGRYADAEAAFELLSGSEQPWLKESALYMSGRNDLNLSQQNAFDAYGFPELSKVDLKPLQTAEEKFSNYLKEYPDGRYSSSARGLLRRVYWLSGQPQKLAEEYAWQMNNQDSPQYNISIRELALEADSKLFASATPEQIKSPLLLATLDLSLMRHAAAPDPKQLKFADLQKQQPLFTGHKELFEYLLAAHRFYVQKDAAGTLTSLSAEIPQKMTYLDFSRLLLRGFALQAAKDYPGARKLWLTLLPNAKQPLQSAALQLALAINYEQVNRLDAVFEANSPIIDPAIRNILIRNSASPDLLRKVIKNEKNSRPERDLATHALLYKDLLQGGYSSYIKDYQLLPADVSKPKPSPRTTPDEKARLALFAWSGTKGENSYNCPSTLDIARKLAKNPTDPNGLLCLGDFAYANNLYSGYSGSRSSQAYGPVLGSVPAKFPAKEFSRGEAYATVIADPNATQDQKAYALYRSIQCYATAGYNHCGGKSVEQPVRKAWFQTLKSRYGNTIWAKSLKYYW